MARILFSNTFVPTTGVSNICGPGNYAIEALSIYSPIFYTSSGGIAQLYFGIQTSAPNFIMMGCQVAHPPSGAAGYYNWPGECEFKFKCPSVLVLQKGMYIQWNTLTHNNIGSGGSFNVNVCINIYGYNLP